MQRLAAPVKSSATPAHQPSKKRGMSPAARKAQGERMRAYWAARRAEKGAGDGSTTSSRKGGRLGGRSSTMTAGSGEESLRDADRDAVAEVAKRHGVSDATIYTLAEA